MAWLNGDQKIDLHRHFGGCISPETISTLLDHKLSVEEITDAIVCRLPCQDFKSFLSKFDILNEISWTEKAIELSIDQVVRDQAADNIDYAEISFSIDKYTNGDKWTKPELIKYVNDVFVSSCKRWNTKVGLILSLRMESCRRQQLVNASLVNRSDIVDILSGLDIVGDESCFDAKFYSPIFKQWRSAGKAVMAHVGETGCSDNVFDAITMLHVHRIRHGISAADDAEVLAAARDLNVCFDISLHSNWLAGTVGDMYNHHLPKLMAAGCRVTLGTDDPVIFGCDLVDEYTLAENYKLISKSDVQKLIENSYWFSKPMLNNNY